MKRIFIVVFMCHIICCYGQKAMLFKDVNVRLPQPTDKSILNFDSSQTDFHYLSSNERLLYYWVNYSRQNPVIFFDSIVSRYVKVYSQLNGTNLNSLKNDFLTVKQLPMLQLDNELIKMATEHAKDITSTNSAPSHNASNGSTFVDRFKKYHFNNCGGENISYGAGDTDPLFMLVLLYLDIGVDDLGHRKALLSSSFITTGISIMQYKNGNSFLVQDFTCSQN